MLQSNLSAGMSLNARLLWYEFELYRVRTFFNQLKDPSTNPFGLDPFAFQNKHKFPANLQGESSRTSSTGLWLILICFQLD